MTHTITYEIERDDETLELVIEYTMSRYVPAQTYGPPEHCSPAEGGEIEELEALLDGNPIELTAEEDQKLQRWIYANHDYASDDGDDDNYPEYD